MAIIVEEQKRGFNWFGTIVFLFVFLLILAGSYYLFFTAVPGIELVAPTLLQTNSQIANLQFDPGTVINHATLKNLKIIAGPPPVGTLGRPNPLIGF